MTFFSLVIRHSTGKKGRFGAGKSKYIWPWPERLPASAEGKAGVVPAFSMDAGARWCRARGGGERGWRVRMGGAVVVVGVADRGGGEGGCSWC